MMGEQRRLHVLAGTGQARKDVGKLKGSPHAEGADAVRGNPVTSRPRAGTRPESGRRCPVIRLKSVDFPGAVGPITATIWRASTSG